MQYGTYKEELWDLHLEQFSVYFHEIDSVKVFSAQIDLITKLNARGGIIGITATGLSIKKITQLIAENSINFCNSVNLDIHSKEYSAEMASRREIEELIFNSRSNV